MKMISMKSIFRALILVIFLSSSYIKTTEALTTDVDCQPGWMNIGVECYKLYKSLSPWESAAKVCKSYGAELATVTDYYENEDIGKFVDSQNKTKVWIGLSRFHYEGLNRIEADAGDQQPAFWSNGDETDVSTGFWKNFQPEITNDRKCVFIEKVGKSYKWSFARCETKMNYLCQRPACPAGSFHCSNTRCINKQLTCDGEDDCGDSSDEINCTSKCSKLMKQDSGTIISPNFPNTYSAKLNCLWVIEVQSGSNVVLEFDSFNTEQGNDVVEILVGGRTESMSELVKRLSGDLNGKQEKFISSNNFMIVKFTSDSANEARGFNASFYSRKANFPDYKELTAIDAQNEMKSPLYDMGWNYIGNQDYTWIITAEKKTKIITLKVEELDFKGNDFVLVRDGDSTSAAILATYKGDTTDMPYVFSTSNKMYITMKTSGYWTGKGFKFLYYQGCSAKLLKDHGHIFSPGFGVSKYADNQICTWNVNNEENLTFRFEKFETQENTDILTISLTARIAGATKVILKNLSGDSIPDPIRKNGIFDLTFETNAIIREKGFSIKYSKDCKNPNFNSETILKPSPANWWYGSQFEVSCKTGYHFASKEFQNTTVTDKFVSLSFVTMKCLYGGIWSTRTLPVCEPMYCGQAPPVDHAYIATSYPSGPDSSVFGGVVSYNCYPGFTMTGNANITCLDDGTWESRPACTVASCSSLPEKIPNGLRATKEGDGTAFGSIVQYNCNEGYHIVGKAILFCESTSNWSGSVPTCKMVTCKLPMIENGELENNDIVFLNDKKKVTCNTGYEFSAGVTEKTLKCEKTGNFTPAVESIACNDVDECTKKPCEHRCVNTDGSYFCSCNDGYTLNQDKSNCDDVDECAVEKGGCSHMCVNTDGGYSCTCQEGYSLFNDNGTEGFNIPTGETGKLAGDLFHLNHTCVLKLCSAAPVIQDGYVLSKRKENRYGDSIEISCKIGFKLEGESLLQCNSSGAWDKATPKCTAAKCPADTIPSGLKTAAVVSPTTPVDYLGDVTLQCNVPGKTSFQRTRSCLYQQPDNKYQLDGAPYECGEIDCGEPSEIPGSEKPTTDTKYNSTFNFVCKTLYKVAGTSQDGNYVVRCGSDGYWGFNTLRCLGKTCTDPGRPVDGVQSKQTNQYQETSEVTFNCSRPGFSIVGTNPIKCVTNNTGTGLEWSAPVPTCKDTEKPTFKNCEETKFVSRYSSASDVVPVPTPQDNVGIKSFTISPQWPSSEYIIYEDVVFIFSAADFEGNSFTCTTNIKIKDEVKPTIECPDPVTKYITDNENITDTLTKILVQVSDNSGDDPDVVFNPPSLFANKESINTVVTIEAKATDKSGNFKTCNFEYLIKAAPCSPLSLVAPLHGNKSCVAQTNNAGFTCTLTCDADYAFYDQSVTALATTSLDFTCNTGSAWNVNIPACADVKKLPATFKQKIRVNYNYSGDAALNCKTNYASAIESRFTVQSTIEKYAEICNALTDTLVSSVSITSPQNDIVIDDTKKEVYIDYTITFDWKKIGDLQSCTVLVQFYLQKVGNAYSDILEGPLSSGGCPKIYVVHQTIADNLAVGKSISRDYTCPDDKKRTKYLSAEMCMECPEGTYNSGGNTCTLCPEDQYTDRPGQKGCLNCDSGTFTYKEGSTAKSQCFATCAIGSYSENQLQPCVQCALNTYGINSTYCDPCPTDTSTLQIGATSKSMCREKCPKGHYNANDGYQPCSVCIKDFYQESVGQKECVICGSNDLTEKPGSISSFNCSVQDATLCTSTPCNGHGTCTPKNHSPICSCEQGYTGEKCENMINECESEPCYNGGNCNQNMTSHYCDCKPGTSGDNCEVDANECESKPCVNGAMCQDLINDYKCHCLPGFGGKTCLEVEQVCKTKPCQHGMCIPQENIRRKCVCEDGYKGKDCSETIDDCESNPCYYGGNCTDKHLDFDCACPTGYTGTRCENPPKLCLGVSCGSGECVEDHIHDTYRCICNADILYGKFCQFSLTLEKMMNTTANKEVKASYTAKKCLMDCEGDSACGAFTFDTSSNDCYLHEESSSMLKDSPITNYYIKTCSNRSDDFWTPWYNTDSPGATASSMDVENISTLSSFGIEVCKGTTPLAIECRDVTNKEKPNEVVTCTVAGGLRCVNNEQSDNRCMDYEIRYKCAVSRVFTENTCTPQSYCTSNPCHKGTCQPTNTGFTCVCNTGYSGSLCQHDIDYCAENPCLNGATCQDRLTDYTCKCAPGFTGLRCQTNINECSSDPCKNSGTCQDRENGYKCDCASGWKGPTCEVDINECDLSEPCWHDGECKNTNGSYECKCSSGWEGVESCTNIVKKCNSSTCEHSAECFDLFNDFFCKCKANTYGETCGNDPSICANANPCQNSNHCNETDGLAKCYCTDDYEGNGCELSVDHCKANTCKNGATCTQTAKNDYKCTCQSGYDGKNCENNVNNCAGVLCTGGTCIDGVNEYFCRCPVNKTGASCAKDVDTNYDLLFELPQKTNMAYVPYPIPLKVSKLTISMWVKFWKIDGKGTFFSMFSVKTPNCLREKKELLRVDEKGIHISFNDTETLYEFSYEKYNDGRWKNIIISWDSTTGDLNFMVNGINRRPIKDYAKGVSLDKNLWLLLGSKYDPDKEKPVINEGFNGWVSQVTIYDRVLTFNDEVQQSFDNPRKLFENTIFVWNEFVRSTGIKMITPSTVSSTACPRGMTPDCSSKDPKKVMVLPTYCPSDIKKLGPTRITSPIWTDPKFSGGVNNVLKTKKSGDPFLWGKYLVVYVAENSVGNKGLCSFKVFVQYKNCPKPKDPYQGSASILNYQNTFFYTSINCNPNKKVVRPVPKIYTCGRIGSWDPPNKFLNFRLPSCGAKKTNTLRAVKVKLVYKVETSYCDGVKSTLETEIKKKIIELNKTWPNLCKKADCDDLQIVIECGPNLIRKRRKRASNDVIVDITLPQAEVSVTSTSGETLDTTDVLRKSIFTDNDFNFQDIISGAIPISHEVVITADLACPSGQALVEGECVECAPGTFYNNVSKICEDCPIGEYQPQAGQSSCTPCTSGTTELAGSSSNSDCKVSCVAGEFFNITSEKCEKCDYGFYQSKPGQFYCEPCVVENTTRSQGSTSESDCYNDCPPGQEISQDGTCQPCPIGKYRAADDRMCIGCPEKKTTNITGATSISLCNVGDCQPGYYRDAANELQCLECDIGFYQDKPQQYQCESCGGVRFTTEDKHSTSVNDCKFFCPDGEEQLDTSLNKCSKCEIGFYRNSTGQHRFDKCQACPGDHRTPTTGSVSKDQCNIYKCIAGEEPNTANTGCNKCGIGFYQDLPDQTSCKPCDGMTSTRQNGSVNSTQCEKYCSSGYEKDKNEECQPCPIGYYKDNSVDLFGKCTQCGKDMGEDPVTNPDFVTETNTSISASNCTVRNCKAGYKIKADDSGCEICPLGKYQPLPYQNKCIPCTSQKSTRQNGSKSIDDCETYCSAGKEKNVNTGICEVCERGYFKDNTIDLFSMCTVCSDPDFITSRTGATSENECTVANCTVGYYLDNIACKICPKGSYSDVMWSTSCTKCTTDKTTIDEGSNSITDCILSCPAGKEDEGETKCVPCKQGFYKTVEKAAKCTPCPDNTTTAGEGSTNENDCNIVACMPGYFRTSTKCNECAYGYYQPEKWQDTCKRCGSQLTTYKKGATNVTDCLPKCIPGEELINRVCTPCMRGYFQDNQDKESYTCTLCPVVNITIGSGATSVSDCSIANCTIPGYYRNTFTNECDKCKRGTYQSEKWKDSCNHCSNDYTTKELGSTSATDCMRNCPSGQELDEVNDRCKDCVTGTFRDSTQSWKCLKCPNGLVTQGPKAVMESECSVSPCIAGDFFNRTSSKCEMCPVNKYQSASKSFSCDPCPVGYFTDGPGKTSHSDCKGHCELNKPTCGSNAKCVNTATSYTCQCDDDYAGNGTICVHKCDMNYCNSGECIKGPPIHCLCDDLYKGDQCQTRLDAQTLSPNTNQTIIIAVVTVLAILLFIIIIVVCICVMARKRQRKRPLTEFDDRASIATRMSTKVYDNAQIYPTKPPSLTGGQRFTLPQQHEAQYLNPVYNVGDDDPAIYKA